MALIQCKKCEKAFDTSLIPPGSPILCTYCGWDNGVTTSAEPAPTAPPPVTVPPAYGYGTSENKNSGSGTPSPDGRISCEWEQNWKSAPLQSYVNMFKAILSEPVGYFKTLKPFEDYTSLAAFIYINGFLAFLGAMLTQVVIGLLPMAFFPGEMKPEELMGGVVAIPMMICLAFVAPLLGILGLAIMAGIRHFFLVYVGGSQKSFDTTFTVEAMNSQANVISVIPVVGGLIAMVYAFIIGIGGQAEAHEIPVSKSLVAFLLPIVICCCCIIGFALLGVGIPALVEGLK